MPAAAFGRAGGVIWDPHRLGRRGVAAAGPIGAYVHFPFCRRHCWYCDFNVHVGGPDEVAEYLAALETEIGAVAAFLEPSPDVATIYVGGGTPSHAGPERLGRLLERLRRSLRLRPGGEFSVEVNPADASAELFAAMTAAGATRLSLGVQSFADERLGQLDRDHRGDGARRAVELAQAAGFGSISIDLIYGTPGQSPAEWAADLESAVSLGVDHVSCYALTLDSPRARTRSAGLGDVPDGDGMFVHYRAALKALAAAGFEHYETSNWARPGHRCRHNSAVWAGARYLPLGCGAHGFLGDRRYHLVRQPDRYVNRLQTAGSLLAGSEDLCRDDLLAEAIALPLRTRAGVDLARLRARFGYDLGADHSQMLRRLEGEGLIRVAEGRIRPSDRGMFVADGLGAALVPPHQSPE